MRAYQLHSIIKQVFSEYITHGFISTYSEQIISSLRNFALFILIQTIKLNLLCQETMDNENQSQLQQIGI